MTIGERIKKVRELKGYKQELVAERLNMTQANYSKYESTDADPSLSKLESIAVALEVDLDDILNFERKVFIRQTNSVYSNKEISNSPISINDLKLFEEIINSKNKIIDVLELQIQLLQSLKK